MPHGLSVVFMSELKSGSLAWLLEYIRTDQTLNLEIRDDEIQLYYRGGRLMHVKRKADRFPSTFDRKYIRAGRPMPCDTPVDARKEKDWTAAIPLFKREMDYYFATTKAGAEREFQQVLARENNRGRLAGSTDYLVCSTEYQSRHGRFDAVGVHWPSDGPCRKRACDLPLVLIEIKYGDGAIAGGAGLKEHLEDFTQLARDQDKLDALCGEMATVLRQKQELGLIQGAKREVVSISASQLQVLFILANTDPSASRLATALATIDDKLSPLFPGGVWISRASQFGTALHHHQNMSISEFRVELERQRERCRQWNRRFLERGVGTSRCGPPARSSA